MTKPLNNFVLCIGTQKAGTTWLYENLADSEFINTSFLKETDFFNFKFIPEQRDWIRKSLINRYLQKINNIYTQNQDFNEDDYIFIESNLKKIIKGELDEKWYFDQFLFDAKVDGKINFDVTPEYIMLPDDGIKYLMNLLSEPKIIVMLRNPVDRLLSHIKMIINNDRNGLYDESELIHFLNDPQVNIRSRYDLLIPKWENLVPKKNIKYIVYDDIKENPECLLNELNQFMGLDEKKEWPLARTTIHAGINYKLPDEFIEKVNDQFKDVIEWCKFNFENTSINNW